MKKKTYFRLKLRTNTEILQQLLTLHTEIVNRRERYSVSVRHRSSNGITGRHKIVNGGKCYIVLQFEQKHFNILMCGEGTRLLNAEHEIV